MGQHTLAAEFGQQPSRHAFSMVELLVVLLIIITLMGIGVGTWMNTAENNSTVGTQNLIGSFIQQARNRSISQGLPVVLQISDQDNSISGITQTFVWQESFDWPAAETETVYRDPASDPLVDAPVPAERSFGRSGYAWKYPYAAPTSGQQFFLKAFDAIPTSTVSGSETYTPLFTDEHDGFYVNCSVKAPNVDSAPQSQIPLLLITKKGNSDNVDEAIAGIELWRVSQFMTDGPVDIKIGSTWTVVAWVKQRPNYPADLSIDTPSLWNAIKSANNYVRYPIDHELSDGTIIHQSRSPYIGDQWIDIGFAYDSNTLYLFRDGQRVDINVNAISTLGFTPSLDEEISVYVGRHSIGSIRHMTSATIDDSSIIRIGSGQRELLNNGIGPNAHYKIVCDNGMVACYKDGTTTDTLEFINTNDNSGTFNITVNSDGSLEHTVITTAPVSGP